MKSIIIFTFLSLISSLCAYSAESSNINQAEQIINKANKLFDTGGSDAQWVSLDLFSVCYNDTKDSNCIASAINIIKKEIQLLPPITKTTMTNFTPVKEYNELSEMMTLMAFVPPKNYGFSAGMPIQTKSVDEATKVAELFLFFKQWIPVVNKIALKCYTMDDQNICLDYVNILNKIKERLNGYFHDYFSYELASPILARTQQLIFRSKDGQYIGNNKDILRDAAKMMGSLNKETIELTYQDVRNQFLDTIRQFKNEVGSAFQEEMKVIQTLQDTVINNKFSESIF